MSLSSEQTATVVRCFETLAREWPEKYGYNPIYDDMPEARLFYLYLHDGKPNRCVQVDHIIQDDVDAILDALPEPLWWECGKIESCVGQDVDYRLGMDVDWQVVDIENFNEEDEYEADFIATGKAPDKLSCAIAALDAAVKWSVERKDKK